MGFPMQFSTVSLNFAGGGCSEESKFASVEEFNKQLNQQIFVPKNENRRIYSYQLMWNAYLCDIKKAENETNSLRAILKMEK